MAKLNQLVGTSTDSVREEQILRVLENITLRVILGSEKS
jgi:hypothetical protein